MKEVSIIIPSITWEPFTEGCVNTCALLFPNSTIILVLDSQVAIETKVNNLIVLYGQTGTISKKRNMAVDIAKTEFIAFIDSDAFPHHGWLSNALQTLRTDKSVGFVGGPNISPPAQEAERNLVGMAVQSWLVAGKWNFYKSTLSSPRYCDNLPSCNLVLRKHLYDQLKGMKEELEVGEDTDFCARIIASGYKVYFNPSVIVYHYDRKIKPYFRQRMVRGAGVFLHVFGNSAQKKSLYTYLMLQPFFAVLLLVSFPIGCFWQPWLYLMVIIGAIYAFLILIEAKRYSTQIKYLPQVYLLILAGNILPGVGLLLKMIGAFPSLHSFYRNDTK